MKQIKIISQLFLLIIRNFSFKSFLLQKEQKRVESLVKVEAVPTKQLDDLVGQIEVLKKPLLMPELQFSFYELYQIL